MALIRLRGCAVWSAPLLFAYDIRHIFADKKKSENKPNQRNNFQEVPKSKIECLLWSSGIKDAYLNCLKFTGWFDFQLHFKNCISKNSFTKSCDEKIIFINNYDLCKIYMMNLLYLVHTLIYNMDIYKTPNFIKCFHVIFITHWRVTSPL